ncbi:MAG: hypothetical protein M1828_004122 [Chrysothrix sp. TS-e1954]|nr:MAG: hypothetical protein M1828_004122 [Chrysothrix sp. TS-e1954]
MATSSSDLIVSVEKVKDDVEKLEDQLKKANERNAALETNLKSSQDQAAQLQVDLNAALTRNNAFPEELTQAIQLLGQVKGSWDRKSREKSGSGSDSDIDEGKEEDEGDSGPPIGYYAVLHQGYGAAKGGEILRSIESEVECEPLGEMPKMQNRPVPTGGGWRVMKRCISFRTRSEKVVAYIKQLPGVYYVITEKDMTL